MIASKRVGLFLAGLFMLNQGAFAVPRTFQVGDSKGRDMVNFTSDAPIELIVGNTHKITGKIVLDNTLDLTKPVEAIFEVDLSSIDTGIPLRNEHMRNNFLETDKYPKAVFVLKKLINPPARLSPGKTIRLMAQGDFSCHGKTVSKTVPVDLTYLQKCPGTETKIQGCDLMQVKTSFAVPFKDHAIKRPEIVFQKLADTVLVTVAATAFSKAQ